MLLTCNRDYTVSVWSVEQGKKLLHLQGEKDVYNAAFSPDSRHVVTGSDRMVVSEKYGGALRIWRISDGKLLRRMDETGTRIVVPRRDPSVAEEPFLDFEAGYVMRSIDSLPKQGATFPWRLKMNYFKDILVFRKPVEDEALEFSA